jgi:hypothetical protein
MLTVVKGGPVVEMFFPYMEKFAVDFIDAIHLVAM